MNLANSTNSINDFDNREMKTKSYEYEIVASVLTNNDKIALFKRSQKVQGDQGLWHCITGFLDGSYSPSVHVKAEIQEEASIDSADLKLVNSCKIYIDDCHNNTWCIHAFHYETLTRSIETNWENDHAQWCTKNDIGSLDTVSWLSSVICALQVDEYIALRG